MASVTVRRVEGEPERNGGAWAQRLRFALGVVLVAVLAAEFAVAFRASLSWVMDGLGGSNVVSVMLRAPNWLRIGLPALGGLLAGGVSLLIARAPGGGVGNVMEAVVLGRVQLSF